MASELAELNSALTTTTELRGQEKEENMDTLTKANEGPTKQFCALIKKEDAEALRPSTRGGSR